MTINWTMNNPHGVDESAVDALTDVLWNGAITKSSTDHFTVKVADIKIVFDGDFTGDPVSAGAITGFHLFQEGVRTLDASGYNLDFHDVLEGIQNAGGDGAALLAILAPGPMNITGSSQNDIIWGSNFADVINAGNGDDTVFGIGGNDHIKGGKGNDTLVGAAGKDVLIGGKGNDHLYASGEKDKLTGGSGNDTFHFYGLDGFGVVTDFKVGHDHFELNQYAFTGFGHAGTVKAGEFHIGTHAVDGNDHLIYDDNTGALYYDSDGAGDAGQIKFGRVDAHLNLSHHDFSLVTPLG